MRGAYRRYTPRQGLPASGDVRLPGDMTYLAHPPPAARHLPTLLLLLTVFGPISMDLYLPALPALTAELGAATSTAQLTVTACLVGLALGQLVAGPLSDRLGRRPVLLVGVVAYVATSLLCAASPSVELLVAARLVQGLAGGVGIVIAQAAGRDVLSGDRLMRFYGQLTVVGGLAAVVGPLARRAADDAHRLARDVRRPRRRGRRPARWPSLALFPETLPAGRRTTGGFAQTARDYRVLLADRTYLGAVLSQGFVYAALFAYLAGATYVLQGIYGLSPQGYALAFGLNSAGFMVFGHLAGRCVGAVGGAAAPCWSGRRSPASARPASCSPAWSRSPSAWSSSRCSCSPRASPSARRPRRPSP